MLADHLSVLTPDQRRREEHADAAAKQREEIISRLDNLAAKLASLHNSLEASTASTNSLALSVAARLDTLIDHAAPSLNLRGIWKWLLFGRSKR